MKGVRKIVGVVAWDCPMARIADRAGIDLISVGDSVGVNLWGRDDPLDITMEEMLIVSKAVRRGTKNALVSVDVPFGPVQESPAAAVRAASRLVAEAGADMVKLDAAADFPEVVEAVARAGIPVFAHFGITPQTASKHGIAYADIMKPGVTLPESMTQSMVDDAKRLESAGASLLDFQHSGPVAGPAVTAAVKIPVIGGQGGGPWLDGRMRLAHAAIGYPDSFIDSKTETYAYVARTALEALSAYAQDVRDGRHLKGQGPKKAS
jgi:Ketopantoate hydroxymethyltransferase